MPIKKQISKKEDECLSQLIRLKRNEKPDDAFWENFDENLRSKQLSALVETHTWYARTGKLSLLLAKKSAAVLATGGALALTFLAVDPLELNESTPTPADTTLAEVETEDVAIERPLFVVDSNASVTLPQKATSFESQLSDFSIPATYGINVLSSNVSESRYQLNTTPKTLLTSNRQYGESTHDFGAKIILAKPAN